MLVLTQRPAKLFVIAPQHPRNQAGLHGAFCWDRDGDLDRVTFDAPGPELTRVGGGVGGVSHGTLEVPLSKGEDPLSKKKKIKNRVASKQETADQDMIIYVKKNSFL